MLEQMNAGMMSPRSLRKWINYAVLKIPGCQMAEENVRGKA